MEGMDDACNRLPMVNSTGFPWYTDDNVMDQALVAGILNLKLIV